MLPSSVIDRRSSTENVRIWKQYVATEVKQKAIEAGSGLYEIYNFQVYHYTPLPPYVQTCHRYILLHCLLNEKGNIKIICPFALFAGK